MPQIIIKKGEYNGKQSLFVDAESLSREEKNLIYNFYPGFENYKNYIVCPSEEKISEVIKKNMIAKIWADEKGYSDLLHKTDLEAIINGAAGITGVASVYSSYKIHFKL